MVTMKHRPSPLVEPPSASSSSSEENDRNASSQKPEEEEDLSDDDSSSEEETEEVHARNASSQKPKEEDSSDDDSSSEEETDEVHARNASSQKPEEEDDSSSEEETEEVHASIKPPPPALTSNPKPASSESESGSESESDSEPKPELTPPPTTKSGTKRAMENTNTESDSKRSKKKAIPDNGSDVDEKEEEKDFKKTPSHRLFSEEDELAILKGLADFISKTGKDPVKHTQAFYSFVKKSIQADANQEQLRRKIRSLKNKYESNGNFTKQHDKDAFELFQKIDFKNEEKTVKKEGSSSDVEKGLAFTEMVRFGDEMRSYGLNIPAMKKGMELIEESNKAVLKERLKDVEIAEMKLLIARAELVRDQASLTLEAYNNSN